MLNNQPKYLCNIYPIISESVKLTNAISICKYTSFLYGRAAIYRESGRFITCYIKKAKKSLTGKIIKLDLPLADTVLSSYGCLLYKTPSPRDGLISSMPYSA